MQHLWLSAVFSIDGGHGTNPQQILGGGVPTVLCQNHNLRHAVIEQYKFFLFWQNNSQMLKGYFELPSYLKEKSATLLTVPWGFYDDKSTSRSLCSQEWNRIVGEATRYCGLTQCHTLIQFSKLLGNNGLETVFCHCVFHQAPWHGQESDRIYNCTF